MKIISYYIYKHKMPNRKNSRLIGNSEKKMLGGELMIQKYWDLTAISYEMRKPEDPIVIEYMPAEV